MEKTVYIRNNTLPSEYRLKKVNEIENFLEKEILTREHLRKKYSRANQIISVADGALSTATIGFGITGVALLSTIVSVPMGLVVESASVGTGLLCVIAKFVNKKFKSKEDKHRQIHILAETKLNTLYALISKAITDGHISDQEFSMVLEEVEKYKVMKENIRMKIKRQLNKTEKEGLIEKGKSELRMKFERFFKSEIQK